MHEYCHAHEQGHRSREESLALLDYMIKHNTHHAHELHELAHSIDGDTASLIHDAIVDFELANEKLEEALQILSSEC